MPAQKDIEDLWSHVYTIHARTCFRFGADSSVAVMSALGCPASVPEQYESGSRRTYTRCLPYINGQVSLSFGHVDVPRTAAAAAIVVRHLPTSSRSAVVLRFNGPAKTVEDTSCAFASQLEGSGKEQTEEAENKNRRDTRLSPGFLVSAIRANCCAFCCELWCL